MNVAWRRVRGGALAPHQVAASVAVGSFVTCLPLYGLQTPLCALLTLPMRLDFAVAWAVTLLANPITAPILAWAEIQLGAWICTGAGIALPSLQAAPRDLLPYAKLLAAGSVALAVLAAAVGGALAYGVARARPRRSAVVHSTTRTEST